MMLRLEVVLGRMLWSCLVVAEPKNSMFQFTEIIGFLGRYLVVGWDAGLVPTIGTKLVPQLLW